MSLRDTIDRHEGQSTSQSAHFTGSDEDLLDNCDNRESLAEEQERDESQIPPFELTLQSILGAPLDTTVWRLKGLHDSQVALTTQLNLLMSTLESYRTGTCPVKLKETVLQIKKSKQRLHTINMTLEIVESRIQRVRDRLVAVYASEPPAPRRTLG